jgi:hypothetical protein
MIDVSATHPFVAFTAFAVEWLNYIAAYELGRAEALIDVNETERPFTESFPAPDGFSYSPPLKADGWTIHFVAVSESGFYADFEVPFIERGFRPITAKFDLRRLGDHLEVRFCGLDLT